MFSYIDLKRRVLRDVAAARVDDQIFEVVRKAFEDALKQENVLILLARVEKKRLLAQVMKQVLTDMVRKLDESTKL